MPLAFKQVPDKKNNWKFQGKEEWEYAHNMTLNFWPLLFYAVQNYFRMDYYDGGEGFCAALVKLTMGQLFSHTTTDKLKSCQQPIKSNQR